MTRGEKESIQRFSCGHGHRARTRLWILVSEPAHLTTGLAFFQGDALISLEKSSLSPGNRYGCPIPHPYHLDASKSVISENWARHSPASLPDLVKLWFLKLSQGAGNMDDGHENKWSLWAQDSDAFSYLGSWGGAEVESCGQEGPEGRDPV